MVQVRVIQNITLKAWWDAAYPYAVKLEKNITTSPQEQSEVDIRFAIQTLVEVLKGIQQQAYPDSASILREHLLRATTYLIHAYQEIANNNKSEADFYYSTALTNVAQLHHQLVQHGFAN